MTPTPVASKLGLLVGVPTGVVYFLLFGFHILQALAVMLFVYALFSVLADTFLAVVKIADKLNINLDHED